MANFLINYQMKLSYTPIYSQKINTLWSFTALDNDEVNKTVKPLNGFPHKSKTKSKSVITDGNFSFIFQLFILEIIDLKALGSELQFTNQELALMTSYIFESAPLL